MADKQNMAINPLASIFFKHRRNFHIRFFNIK